MSTLILSKQFCYTFQQSPQSSICENKKGSENQNLIRGVVPTGIEPVSKV